MFEFFSQIIGFIQTIYNAIVNTLLSLHVLLDSLTLAPILNTLVLSFFPPVIAASFTAVLAIAIVKLIVGR